MAHDASVSDIDRRKVGALWAFRAGGEREAHDRFGRLANELARAAAIPSVVEMARAASADEARHEGLCRDLAAAHGVTYRDTPRVSTPVGDPSFTLGERVLAEVVSLCCIGETLATTVLATTLEAATAHDVREVVHAILADEVRHSRLGWAHLAAESERGRAAFLGDFLPSMLAAGVPPDLFARGAAEPGEEALRAYGVLSKTELVEIFRATMSDVILPGFERLGVDATKARAWLQSHDPTATQQS